MLGRTPLHSETWAIYLDPLSFGTTLPGLDGGPRGSTPPERGRFGGRNRRRSGDLALFRRALCQLSYPTLHVPPP